MTNFEKIKNMSVEEMVNYLFNHPLDFNPCSRECKGCQYFHECRDGNFDQINNEVRKHIQEWLESEAEK